MATEVPPPRNDLPPLSRDELKGVFDHLCRPNPPPCLHTFEQTSAYLRSRGLQVGQTIEWLMRNGAGCDCEVIFNTDEMWGPWAGRSLDGGDE